MKFIIGLPNSPPRKKMNTVDAYCWPLSLTKTSFQHKNEHCKIFCFHFKAVILIFSWGKPAKHVVFLFFSFSQLTFETFQSPLYTLEKFPPKRQGKWTLLRENVNEKVELQIERKFAGSLRLSLAQSCALWDDL